MPDMMPAHRVMLEAALRGDSAHAAVRPAGRGRTRGGLGDGGGAEPGRAVDAAVPAAPVASVLDWLVRPKRNAMLDNQIDAHPSLCYVEQDPARAHARRGRLVSIAVYGTSKGALGGDADRAFIGDPFMILRGLGWDADDVLPRATALQPGNEQAVSLLRRMPFRTSSAGIVDAMDAPSLADVPFARMLPGSVRELARRSHWQYSQRLDAAAAADGPLERFAVVDGRCWVKLKSEGDARTAAWKWDESFTKKSEKSKMRVFEHPDDASSVLIGTQGRMTDEEVLAWVHEVYPVGRTRLRHAHSFAVICSLGKGSVVGLTAFVVLVF